MASSYRARVLYDFTGEVAGDLTVTAGEEVTILLHLEAEEGWVQATNREGEQGILPESYTESIDQEEQSDEEEEERFNLGSVRPNTWDDDIDDDDERNEDFSEDPETLCLAPGPGMYIGHSLGGWYD